MSEWGVGFVNGQHVQPNSERMKLESQRANQKITDGKSSSIFMEESGDHRSLKPRTWTDTSVGCVWCRGPWFLNCKLGWVLCGTEASQRSLHRYGLVLHSCTLYMHNHCQPALSTTVIFLWNHPCLPYPMKIKHSNKTWTKWDFLFMWTMISRA